MCWQDAQGGDTGVSGTESRLAEAKTQCWSALPSQWARPGKVPGWAKGTDYETWPGRSEEMGGVERSECHVPEGSRGADINSVSASRSKEPDIRIQKHEIRPPRGQSLGSRSQARGVPGSVRVSSFFPEATRVKSTGGWGRSVESGGLRHPRGAPRPQHSKALGG